MAGELERLLSEWSARRQIGSTDRDESGRHFLVFDGRFEVALSQLGDAIYLESDIAPLPVRRDQAEELLERLLKLQLARARFGKDILSITEDGATIMLFRPLRVNRMTLKSFEEDLGAFVNSLAFMASDINATAPRAPRPVMPAEQVFIP